MTVGCQFQYSLGHSARSIFNCVNICLGFNATTGNVFIFHIVFFFNSAHYVQPAQDILSNSYLFFYYFYLLYLSLSNARLSCLSASVKCMYLLSRHSYSPVCGEPCVFSDILWPQLCVLVLCLLSSAFAKY